MQENDLDFATLKIVIAIAIYMGLLIRIATISLLICYAIIWIHAGYASMCMIMMGKHFE